MEDYFTDEKAFVWDKWEIIGDGDSLVINEIAIKERGRGKSRKPVRHNKKSHPIAFKTFEPFYSQSTEYARLTSTLEGTDLEKAIAAVTLMDKKRKESAK